jgi:alkylated DNA nucleotide flippase Atl1
VRSTRPASSSVGLGVRAGSGARPTEYARAVLDVVDRIPAGTVMTYGDVASSWARGSPRTVGTVLSDHGPGGAWQRVVQASGRPPSPTCRRRCGSGAEGLPAARASASTSSVARWDGGAAAGHGADARG